MILNLLDTKTIDHPTDDHGFVIITGIDWSGTLKLGLKGSIMHP